MPLLLPIRRATELIAGSTWPKKTTKFLCGLIIFFSATQFGLHFWPNSAFVYGLRIDYLSPTLYFLDFLIIAYLVIRNCLIIGVWKLRFIIPLLIVNLLFSQNPWATLSWSLHFFLYLAFTFSLSGRVLKSIIPILATSIFFQVILSIVQVIQGHSVQGLLYYFGERMVSIGLPSVAVGSFMGQVVLRAYGTFSHPNILAGYCVIVLLIIIIIRRSRLIMDNWLLVISTLGTALNVVLTQSRSAALSLFGLVIPFYIFKSLRTRILYFMFLLCTMYFVLSTGALTRDLDLSINDRTSLLTVSTRVTRAYPIFGVGANASITRYPDLVPNFRLFQPDHNSYTLFLSWFGLFGLIAFLLILNPKHFILKALLPLLPLLLLDHYFLTSPQGFFVLLLYLRTIWLTDNQIV